MKWGLKKLISRQIKRIKHLTSILKINKEQLIFKSFLISLFLHLFILFTFVFGFLIPKGQSKPFFVFLGAILQEQDLRPAKIDQVNPVDLESMRYSFHENVIAVHPVLFFAKPDFQSTIFKRKKIVFKSPFSQTPLPSAELPHDNQLLKKMGIKESVPRYKSLRLYPND